MNGQQNIKKRLLCCTILKLSL